MKLASLTIELMSRADGGDDWVHLVPSGTFHGRDGRGPYKLTNASAVIASSREAAGKRLIPIDYDHALDLGAPNGVAAPAAGWINALHSRSDGIWGRVEWTPRAADHLAQREYRYLSPVFRHAADGTIHHLLRAALTNTPNLDQLTALASMETNMEKLAELRKLLGLADNADMDTVLARVGELSTSRQAAAPDPAKFVPIGDFERAISEVNRLNQGVSLQAATDHVTTHINAGNLLPWLKDWGVSLCSTNKPAFDDFVKRTKGALEGLLTPSRARLTPPGVQTAGDLSDEEIAIATNLGVSQDAYLKTKTARQAQES